jgi:cell division protein FtsW
MFGDKKGGESVDENLPILDIESYDDDQEQATRKKPAVKIPRGPMDLPFIILTLLVLGVGLIMMFSASYARAISETGNPTFYIMQQLRFAIAGVVIMVILSFLDYGLLYNWSKPLYVVAIGLNVAAVIFGGGRGTSRWLDLGFVRFQPSEIAKFAMIILLAAMISKYGERVKYTPKTLILGSVLVLPVLIVASQRHLSGTILIALTGAAILFAGGVRMRWFAALITIGTVGGLWYINTFPYAMRRIEIWQNPDLEPLGAGFQTLQSLMAIGSGGFLGVGLGRSRQKYQYLPEQHNDFIFSIVCEELGFLGALIIMTLFCLLILRGFWVAVHSRDRFGSLLVVGICAKLAFQVFLNIAVVTNFVPPTGIALPFFSYGGTALVMQMAEMGIVLGVSRRVPAPKSG